MAVKIILAGTLFYLAFGWLIFGWVLGDYTDTNTTHLPGFKKSSEDLNYCFLVLSCLAYATLITYVLTYLTKTTNLKQSFFISSVIGILVAIMTDSYWYATSSFYNNLLVMILDIAAAGITVGFLGVIVTWLSNKLTKTTSDLKHRNT